MMIFFNNDVINNDINDSDDIINDVLVDKLEVKCKENIKGAWQKKIVNLNCVHPVDSCFFMKNLAWRDFSYIKLLCI